MAISTVKAKKNIHSKKSVTLHSTASHGPAYLFGLIDNAIWLLSQDPFLNQVDIILHPVNLVSVREDLPEKIIQKLYQNTAEFLSTIKASILKVFLNLSLIASRQSKQSNKQVSSDLHNTKFSVYNRIYRRGETVVLEMPVGILTLRTSEVSFAQSFFPWIKAYITAIRLWLKCFEVSSFSFQKFLHLQYRETHIGDLVASQALRSYPKAGGSLRYCKILVSTLAKGVFIRDYIHHNLQSNQESLVTIPEPTYLHGIYLRTLHQMGSSILDPHHFSGFLQLISPKSLGYSPRTIASPVIKKLSGDQIENARAYLNSRIEQPERSLWYMTHGTNRTDNQLLDESNNLIEVPQSAVCPIIFLHSFDDGQYWFGLDGFDDIYHWTEFTIDVLLENQNIDLIFVKAHPNADYETYPGDRVAYRRLRKRYKLEKRICWLRSDISPLAFSQHKGAIGITHHGSVAEELAWLSVPVIASSHAPWGKAYSFLNTWDDPTEYHNILSTIKYEVIDSLHKSSHDDDLLRFITEYRINVLSIWEKSTWLRFGKWFLSCEIECSSNSFSRVSKDLSNLVQSSECFNAFLQKLVEEKQKSSS